MEFHHAGGFAVRVEIQDGSGNAVETVAIGDAQAGIKAVGSFAVVNGDTDNTNGTMVLSAGLFKVASSETNQNGAELVTEAWLEISVSGGAWTPLGSRTSEDVVTIEKSSAWSSVPFELRLNVPSSSRSFGTVFAALEITFH
jgi:hypothetical protein